MFSVRTSENSYCDLLSFDLVALHSWISWLTSKLLSLDQDLIDLQVTVLTSGIVNSFVVMIKLLTSVVGIVCTRYWLI